MKESLKTSFFLFLALVSCLGAYLLRPETGENKEQWSQLGQEFFSHFTDPLQAAVLEVYSFNEATGTFELFKVEKKGNRWYIPSHEDYPADAAEKLAKIATSFIHLKREELRSTQLIDHSSMKLLDPTDEKASSIEGRGTKIVIRDAKQQLLCEYIIGHSDEKPGYRFVRLPHETQSYVAALDLSFSRELTSWINPLLWKFPSYEIREVFVNDYAIVEGKIKKGEPYGLNQDGQGQWFFHDKKGTVKQEKARAMGDVLRQLFFTGVSRKHPRLVKYLQERKDFTQDQEVTQELASKGFYIGPTGVVSDEGELTLRRHNGIIYTLRFGSLKASLGKAGEKNRRHCLILARMEPGSEKEPEVSPMPEEPFPMASRKVLEEYAKKKREVESQMNYLKFWREKHNKAKAEIAELNDRLADWYFLIDQDIYQKIQQSKKELTR